MTGRRCTEDLPWWCLLQVQRSFYSLLLNYSLVFTFSSVLACLPLRCPRLPIPALHLSGTPGVSLPHGETLKGKPGHGREIDSWPSGLCAGDLAAAPANRGRHHYPCVGLLVAIGVEGRKDVNPGLLHQADDACVAGQVLLAQELHEQQRQLPAQHLVAVGPCDVVELRLAFTRGREKNTVHIGASSRTALTI